jgi:hypothetical protein
MLGEGRNSYGEDREHLEAELTLLKHVAGEIGESLRSGHDWRSPA